MSIKPEDITVAMNVCNQIEDKYLERGTFSKYCDRAYEISFTPVIEKGDYSFGLIISIQTDGNCRINSEIAEELIDSAEDTFFEVLALESSNETYIRLRELFDNKSFIVNGNAIY
jgi:hypothetical protein